MKTVRRRAWYCNNCGNWHEYVQPRTLHQKAYVESNRIDEHSDIFDQYTHGSRYFQKIRLRNGPKTAKCRCTGEFRVLFPMPWAWIGEPTNGIDAFT